MAVYEVIKDVKNDKWAIREVGTKEIVKSYSCYSMAHRIATQMSVTFENKEERTNE